MRWVGLALRIEQPSAMFQAIKEWFFRRALPVRKKHSPPYSVNPCRDILILFDGTLPENRDKVANFVSKLSAAKKRQIHCLAYIDTKEAVQDDRFPYFTKKEVGWSGIPSGEQVHLFLTYKADLLLIFCTQLVAPMEYVIAATQAAFVVGPNLHGLQPYCHLLAETGEQPAFSFVISQILHSIDAVAE
jgi:hypothetical protein